MILHSVQDIYCKCYNLYRIVIGNMTFIFYNIIFSVYIVEINSIIQYKTLHGISDVVIDIWNDFPSGTRDIAHKKTQDENRRVG